eukprot:CAMPEP_0195002838 /NCGR_PEP_ID=MMETSP0326_2-20130528/3052_1 /TAXON_ID=2866 ORGANISM="Crypthecodinium cohnii, Strain Seligo" /NCGR_SAMPLE_ID=MMETSP0326_2 /ASSEMBLY_ACC=CAM_ASM_000348 /LENGTH=115 /DNA_ID=CAMNT_0040006837 /DNA_START=545 /DNA_END=889 /DNA_ORIENTATION=+
MKAMRARHGTITPKTLKGAFSPPSAAAAVAAAAAAAGAATTLGDSRRIMEPQYWGRSSVATAATRCGSRRIMCGTGSPGNGTAGPASVLTSRDITVEERGPSGTAAPKRNIKREL